MSLASPLSPAAQAASADAHPVSAGLCHAHKFGGSSVANAARYRQVAALLQPSPAPRVVVSSAMQGVTDALTALANAARAGESWQDEWARLRDQHLAAARELDPGSEHGLALERGAQLACPFVASSAHCGGHLPSPIFVFPESLG